MSRTASSRACVRTALAVALLASAWTGCGDGERPGIATEPPAPRSAPPPAVNTSTDSTFREVVIRESHRRPVLVMFWAPWSGPDRVFRPIVRRAVLDREGRIQLTMVNVDESIETSRRYKVLAVPTLMPFHDGKPILRPRVGAVPRAQVDEFLDEIERTAN